MDNMNGLMEKWGNLRFSEEQQVTIVVGMTSHKKKKLRRDVAWLDKSSWRKKLAEKLLEALWERFGGLVSQQHLWRFSKICS